MNSVEVFVKKRTVLLSEIALTVSVNREVYKMLFNDDLDQYRVKKVDNILHAITLFQRLNLKTIFNNFIAFAGNIEMHKRGSHKPKIKTWESYNLKSRDSNKLRAINKRYRYLSSAFVSHVGNPGFDGGDYCMYGNRYEQIEADLNEASRILREVAQAYGLESNPCDNTHKAIKGVKNIHRILEDLSENAD